MKPVYCIRIIQLTAFAVLSLFIVNAHAVENTKNIMVLDFELKDLTLYENNQQELERTATLKPLLEQALADIGQTEIIDFDISQQAKADMGRGYLYDHHDLVADLGQAHNARWVVVGRVHKPTYLFVYLKVQLIDVTNGSMAAGLTVELKGQRDEFIQKGVHRLAMQIVESIAHYQR